ncbi:hypothetical protein IC620_12940 [Hazenella sp. IB182357]|uniref:CNNM transmembrane domain-containing protein n=1 Tax=Polycladospora coralii TaxID=2771432 RepID=A0A926NCF3_9BACL|nr:hypothetical protein [Polycladospora coralii]MBD1373255.1 hypothetical protein [Polycladospora coralii]MBS7530913.1 hypothetical protein [Polycladospora coralii]
MRALLRNSWRWAVGIFILTFVLALLLSLASTSISDTMSWEGGLLVLVAIVAMGVMFDMLGIAATSAQERPFHSMASKKVPGAKEAVGIVRRADQFSNFCSDVVGDISGVISGAAALAVIASFALSFPIFDGKETIIEVTLISVIAAFTVGGKALGKSISLHYSNEIILFVGKFFHWMNTKFNMKLFYLKPKKKRQGKRGVLRAPRTD